MIASAKTVRASKRVPRWHATFVTTILPAVRRNARIAFSRLDPDAREEAVGEAVAAAVVAYVELVRKGRQHLAFPTTMARFAVTHVKNGRHVGGHMNSRDALSPTAQHRHGFDIEPLGHLDPDEGIWMESLVEDRHATPADLAASRLDVGVWFSRLSDSDRKIAEALAIGGTTAEVAAQFRVSAGRISQKRRQYMNSWQTFQGEPVAELV